MAVHQWRLNSVVRQKTELSTYSWKMVWNNYLTKWIQHTAESCTVKHNFSTMFYFFRYHFYKKWKFYDFLIIMEVFYILCMKKKLYMILYMKKKCGSKVLILVWIEKFSTVWHPPDQHVSIWSIAMKIRYCAISANKFCAS